VDWVQVEILRLDAKQLTRLLSDDALVESCKVAAVQVARERYSWDVIAAEFEAVYQQAIDAKL
jgi:glycosyltransferase involved in cell wall biosynthesis